MNKETLTNPEKELTERFGDGLKESSSYGGPLGGKTESLGDPTTIATALMKRQLKWMGSIGKRALETLKAPNEIFIHITGSAASKRALSAMAAGALAAVTLTNAIAQVHPDQERTQEQTQVRTSQKTIRELSQDHPPKVVLHESNNSPAEADKNNNSPRLNNEGTTELLLGLLNDITLFIEQMNTLGENKTLTNAQVHSDQERTQEKTIRVGFSQLSQDHPPKVVLHEPNNSPAGTDKDNSSPRLNDEETTELLLGLLNDITLFIEQMNTLGGNKGLKELEQILDQKGPETVGPNTRELFEAIEAGMVDRDNTKGAAMKNATKIIESGNVLDQEIEETLKNIEKNMEKEFIIYGREAADI